jgi:uncharacterized low-complexity protein
MRARGLVSALLVAAFGLMPLAASAQIAPQADPGTFTTVELVDSGHRRAAARSAARGRCHGHSHKSEQKEQQRAQREQ